MTAAHVSNIEVFKPIEVLNLSNLYNAPFRGAKYYESNRGWLDEEHWLRHVTSIEIISPEYALVEFIFGNIALYCGEFKLTENL